MGFTLNDVIQVDVNVSPLAVIRNGFNVGLIIGGSSVLSSDRTKVYTDIDEMISDGFTTGSDEYKAATVYFSQSPRPEKVVIGYQAEEETPLVALNACRLSNNEWYAVAFCANLTQAEIIAIAAAVETMVPSSTFFWRQVASNFVATANELKDSKYRRTIGVMVEAGLFTEIAVMGYAMGANKNTANSAYTLAYKKLIGTSTENITDSQFTSIRNANGNVYINQGSYYDVFRQGTMADGTAFDEIINLDKLSNDIQLAVMDALTTSKKIPQTDGGVAILKSVIGTACEASKIRGFIAPGVWNGPQILSLDTGDMLASGYLIQAESSQSQVDRDARKAPPIYVAVKLAGAIEYVVISVDVNR